MLKLLIVQCVSCKTIMGCEVVTSGGNFKEMCFQCDQTKECRVIPATELFDTIQGICQNCFETVMENIEGGTIQ